MIDETSGAITAPEWVVGTKERKATTAAYTNDTVAPAAYILGRPMQLQAKFRSTELSSAVIQAVGTLRNGQPSPYGDLGPQTVTFDQNNHGDSPQVTFTSGQVNSSIGSKDIVFEWQMLSGTTIDGEEVDGASPIGKTDHRIYTVFRKPIAPQEVPWAKVLEIAGLMTVSLGDNPSAAAIERQIASGVFYSRWARNPANARFFVPSAVLQVRSLQVLKPWMQSGSFCISVTRVS